jgi:glycogen debranching enzyme
MAVPNGQINILDGNNFMVTNTAGDIDASPVEPSGLFAFDTRFLSKWVLTVDGQRLRALSVDDIHYFETRFFLVPDTGTVHADVELLVIRQQSIRGSLCEKLTILNHADKQVELTVSIDAASDFADLLEIKNAVTKKGKYWARAEPDGLTFGYERETFRRQTEITTNSSAQFDERGLTFAVTIEPHGDWNAALRVEPAIRSPEGKNVLPGEKRLPREMAHDLDDWLNHAPRLECDWEPLHETYRRSLIDLAALRFSPLVAGQSNLPAAGLPWFMTMFGRDSIFTSLQALPFQPNLAATTIRALAVWQGGTCDDFRDETPGCILHELRYGESAAFEEQPHSPYFGTADATPLFVVLLDEYERWTGDAQLVELLESRARAALNWIDVYGDRTGNGYISYQRRNEKTGLENQCWKDSWDSVSYHDGRLPGFPRATCELQGYAYDAKIRGARLAREIWHDPTYAEILETQAADLKRRFNRDFWLEDRQYYALAIEPDGSRVDALSSNIGHLLWSGIIDETKAQAIVDHLMGPSLFSGWGVRTLAAGEGRYNPVGYHVGTIWPFDNSFIAWGLRRYGYRDEAARIAAGILDMATYFDGRLPEAVGGYDRTLTRYPVQYPTACSPQAWSAGAPLLLLRTMLGLEPVNDCLEADPAFPTNIGYLNLLDIPGRWGRASASGTGAVEPNRTRGLRPLLVNTRSAAQETSLRDS